MFSDRFHIFLKQLKSNLHEYAGIQHVAPARADKSFIDSSPGQIDSYSRNLTTINFSDVSLYLLLTFDGN